MPVKWKSHTTDPARLTMADLAKLAGVSAISVSRSLADSPLVSPCRRDRVRRLAREHGYRLNVNASNLRLRHNRALLLSTRHRAMGMVVQAADGLILLGQGAHQDAARMYDKTGLPMFVSGAATVGDDRHIVVGSDNRHGSMSAAERFVSIGSRHPVFIGNPEMAQRLSGFLDELALHDIKPLLMHRAEFTSNAGVQAVRSLHSRKMLFDAILACSDLMATGAIRALDELGKSVPRDVSVIDYDDTPMERLFCRRCLRCGRIGRREACSWRASCGAYCTRRPFNRRCCRPR